MIKQALCIIHSMMMWVMIALIRLYQYTLSPWVGRYCRFAPSCSHYAIEALRQHGIIKGGWMALRRIMRCNPWGGCGFDPVVPYQPKNTKDN